MLGHQGKRKDLTPITVAMVFSVLFLALKVAPGQERTGFGEYVEGQVEGMASPPVMNLLLDWYGKVASREPSFFFEAAREGNSRRMDALLSNNPDLVYVTDSSGRSGLHWAAIGGQVPEAKKILAAGGVPNLRDNEGKTPFDLAIEYGHKEMAHLFLNGKMTVEKAPVAPPALEDVPAPVSEAPVREAPVPIAPPEISWPETTLLPENTVPALEETSEPEGPLLIPAESAGTTSLFEAMEVPTPEEVAATEAAFRKSVIAGDPKRVEALLRRQPSLIHSRDTKIGWTPLHWAVERQHYDIVQMLLFWGADVNAKEVHGWTPLRMARKNGDRRVFNLLLNHGATE